jgi:hypothetical protein
LKWTVEERIVRWPQIYAVGLRRFLVASGLGLWLGGFTFYSAVVIHIAAEILGDHRPVGFITQDVSNWLNLIGAVVLAILLWNMAAIWPTATRWCRTGLTVTWLSMAIGLGALVVVHHALDAVLNADSQEIVDYRRFIWLHRFYLAISTGQWGAGLLHVWCLVVPAADPSGPEQLSK